MRRKKGIRCLLAPLNGDLVSPSWASGGPWVRGKKKGDRSLRFPGSGTSMPGHGTGPLDAARRMLPAKYSGSDEEEMGRTRFGLVGGKQGLLKGGEGGGGSVVCGFVEVAG